MKPEMKTKVEEMAARYPDTRAALLPALWAVQQGEGWIPPEAMSAIAEILGIAAAEVREVASFYTMFARKPIGRHHLQVCIGMCCRLRGGDAILDHLKALLRIDVGETTDDDAFHLSAVECLGSCGTAPMMQVDDEYYEDLTTERVDEIVARLKEA